MRRICLSAALVMLTAPVFAVEAPDAACMEPTVPTMPNGRTAPAADVVAAANNVKAYVAGSDAYQQCLRDVLVKMEETAKETKKAEDPKLKAALVKKGDDNQKKKEQLGASYAAVAAAYRAAHPQPAKK